MQRPPARRRIVVGAEDQATPPALGRALAGRLANAQLVELPGSGHCPHIQDADVLVAAVAPFLGLRAKHPRVAATPVARRRPHAA